MKDLVYKWLQAGADLTEGAFLFNKVAGSDHPFNKVLHLRSKPVKYALKITLCRLTGIDYAIPIQPVIETESIKKGPSMREDWPFLKLASCPPELKILASNKITAYHNYVEAHQRLFDCVKQEEQLQVVKTLVENYIENREIIAEFEFYKRHGRILGKHRIFQEIRELRSLRKLKVFDLIKLKKNLEQNIWRIRSEMAKRDKPQLDLIRERKITNKLLQISEIDRILSEYE
jgi:hypothetical protein